MSLIDSQFEIGVTQAMNAMGHVATYIRKDTGESVSLLATLTEPKYQISDENSVVLVASDRWEALIMTSELVFSELEYEPKSGDTLIVDDLTYTVTISEEIRYCWTWADHNRLRRRLFLKRIGD